MGHQQRQHPLHRKYNLKDTHGGELRKLRLGRRYRPVSTRKPHHVVFKADRTVLKLHFRSPRTYKLIKKIIARYAAHFAVRVDQCSINFDHIHLRIQTSKRVQALHFMRVVAGQIAQQYHNEGLVTDTPGVLHKALKKSPKVWKHRPFSRIVHGLRVLKIVTNYIQLNEMEARGVIPYQKYRLRGLSLHHWQLLWSG